MSDMSTFSQFQKNWEARSQIAADEGIKPPAIKAVISNDYNRLLAGSSPMSNQDAYAAMASDQQHKVLTGDPTGNGNLFTNAFHDAQGLATGIFHMPEQLLHLGEGLGKGVENAVEGKGLSALGASLAQLAQLVPGVTDAEQLAKGNYDYLWQHPLYSALDLAGVGGVTSKLADLATGASKAADAAFESEKTAAQAAGYTDGPTVRPVPTLSNPEKQITAQNIILSKHPALQLAGRAIKSKPQVDSFLNKTLGPYGLYGNRIKDLITPHNVLQKLGEEDFNTISSQIAQAAEKLNPDQTRQLFQLLTSPHVAEDIASDPMIDNAIKEAYAGWEHLQNSYNAKAIAAGHNVIIRNPKTGQEAVVGAQSAGSKLLREYDTLASKHMAALEKVNMAQNDFLAHSQMLTQPVWDGPIGMPGVDASTKLTAPDYTQAAQQFLGGQDPRAVMAIGPSTAKDSIRTATKRYKALFAPDGPVAKLSAAMRANDKDAIPKLLSTVKARTASKFFTNIPAVNQLRDFTTQYSKEFKEVQKPKYARQVATTSKAAGRVASKLQDSTARIDKRWNRVTADNYEQHIASIMANDLKHTAANLLPTDEQQLSNVMDLLDNGSLYPTGLKPYISEGQWLKVRASAIASYDKLIQAGAKVYWVPKVTENERVGFIRVGADRLPSVSSAKSRALNFSYTIQNPYLGITKAYEELISRQRTDEFYEMAVKPRLMAQDVIQKQAEDTWLALKSSGVKVPDYKEYFHHNYSQWSNFNPSDFLHGTSRHIGVSDDVNYMIDQSDLQLLHNMQKTVRNPATKAWDATLSLFRHAVLTVSPRFFAHITLGGAFLTLGKTGPGILKFIGEGHDMVTKGEWPALLSHGHGYERDLMDTIYDPKKFHLLLGGRSLGRWWEESITQRLHLDSVAGKAAAYHHFLEVWSDHYRAMAYLYGKDAAERAGNPGLTEAELSDAKRWGLDANQYAGVKLANKVLADLNGRTPLERGVIRFAFPFGGWAKHVLRYVLTLPIDHPLRTNFLSNLSEQSYEADTSGLPQYLFHLLYLGSPDSLGNVNVIDFRQWNPLRDVANYLTLGGIVSQLNPAAEGLLSAMGIQSSTGAPELYPQLNYNSFYGGYQVQTPTGNTALSMLGSYIPEFSALDHFLKISSYTRSLAKYDPQAYRNQLWQSLNFPWAPQQVNINQIIAKQETDRLSTLKTMVTSALTQNDMSYLDNLQGPFPYAGWYFTRGQISSIITSANQWAQDTGQPIPASDLLQTPSAPTVPLGITPAVELTPESLAQPAERNPS